MADAMLDILVEPAQANSGDFIAIVTDRSEAIMATAQTGGPEHVWIKHLGTDVSLVWSHMWHAGGYAIRLRRDMLAKLGRALLDAAEADHDGVLHAPEGAARAALAEKGDDRG